MLHPSRSGFTLIELLTVIAVVAILAGIVIPIIGQSRVRAMFAKDASNLRQLGIANQLYMQDHNGRMVAFFDIEARDRGEPTAPWTRNLKHYIDGYQDMGAAQFEEAEQDPDSVFNSPLREDLSAGRSYGLNTQITNPNWNNQYINIPEPGRIVHIGPIEVRQTEWMRSADGSPGWGSPMAFRYGDTVNVLFADGHVGAHTTEELQMEPDDGSKSKFRWW